MKQTRRNFLQSSAKLAGAATFSLGFPAMLKAGVAPSDQVNIGVIGVRQRGRWVMEQHLGVGGVNCVGICDIDNNILQEKAAFFSKKYDQKPNLYTDYRKMLEDKDLDAVIIATPDHWHCLQMVDACSAGKDVYVEKPLANTIAEGEVMVKAAKRYGRVVQVGQQQRSGKIWKEVMAYMKSGKLGHIRKTNIWANFNYGLGPKKVANSAAPAGVDYDRFLGPAPQKPFNAARFHGDWRHFWDYGGGLMTDFGAHLIDMALWVKDITAPPQTILAFGSKLDRSDLAKETYDTMEVSFPIDDYVIRWESNAGIEAGPFGMNYGLAFLGDKGTLVVNRGSWQVIPERDRAANTDKVDAFSSGGYGDYDDHVRNFIDCIKSRETPAASVEIGANVAHYAHAANIAVRSGEHMLKWDAKKGNFGKAKAANRLISPEYRKPWNLPKV